MLFVAALAMARPVRLTPLCYFLVPQMGAYFKISDPDAEKESLGSEAPESDSEATGNETDTSSPTVVSTPAVSYTHLTLPTNREV